MVKQEPMQTENDRLWAVLDLLARYPDPVGSTTISEQLNATGWSMSEATAGRILRRLERAGAVEKRGRQGRVLTSEGEEMLNGLARERRQRTQGVQLSELLSDRAYRRTCEVMNVRLVVEGEAAALAAEHGTHEQLQTLETVVTNSRNRMANGAYDTADDNLFHNTVAEASGNSVLAAMIRFLRESEGMAAVFMQVRYKMGLQSVEDHARIYEAIQSRSPELARAVMRAHLKNVLDDLEHYVADHRAGTIGLTKLEQK